MSSFLNQTFPYQPIGFQITKYIPWILNPSKPFCLTCVPFVVGIGMSQSQQNLDLMDVFRFKDLLLTTNQPNFQAQSFSTPNPIKSSEPMLYFLKQ